MATNTPDNDHFRLPPWAAGMRIGLFGGSFDPPHEGHLVVSRLALKALALDQVWWLVSPQNPLKPNAPSQDLTDRLHAAQKLARHPRIRVTGIEAALGTNYTAETFKKLVPLLNGADLVWLMGADSLCGFHRWRDWSAIAATMPFAVFNRPGLALRALASPAAIALSPYRMREREASALAATTAPAWVFLSRPNIPISSTELRKVRSSN